MATTLPAAGMLGRYQVLKPLAKGGMAEVLLARALGLAGFARYVVIKRIRVDTGSDQQAIDMFLDEARLVASLHHRNIVQVLDVGEEEGKYFFVMEYVHGRDVRELLRKVKDNRQQLPLDHVLSIATAAAAALHYAHEQRGPDRQPLGIVHRDISPGNILVAFDGGVKVVDFGIAKAHARAANTQAGETKGKSGYMSPEQCRAEPVDRRTDVFQLGIVLWELCTVRRLFNKEGRFETLKAVADGEVPPPSRFRSDLPEELERIVLKALAKNPDERFQTADELRLALESVAARAGLTLSAGRLSDYLKSLFGDVPEPWLAEDLPPPAPEMIERARLSGRISVPVIAAEDAADAPTDGSAAPTADSHPTSTPAASAAPIAEPVAASAAPHASAAPQASSALPAGSAPTSSATAHPELAAFRAAKPIVEGAPAKDDDKPMHVAPRRDTPVSWPVDPSSARARKRWLIAFGVIAAGVIAFFVSAFWGTDVPPPAVSPAPATSPDEYRDASTGAADDAPIGPATDGPTAAEQPTAMDAALEPQPAGDSADSADSATDGDPAVEPGQAVTVDAGVAPTRVPAKRPRPRPRPMRKRPAKQPAKQPADPPAKQPADEPGDPPADQPTDPRADPPGNQPTDRSADRSSEPSTAPAREAPADEPSDTPAPRPSKLDHVP